MNNYSKAHVAIHHEVEVSVAIKRTSALLLLFICLSTVVHAYQFQVDRELHISKIESVTDSIAQRIIGKKEVPGMSVAVAKDGKVLFQKCYGKADLELDKDVHVNTVFSLSSVSKQFTAATIMRLIEQGKILLDDPLTKFLPDYPTQGNSVTIHHLLSHTSGMKDYTFKNETLPGWYALQLTYKQMTDLWANQPFETKPGENFDYNNLGYYLLGQIIEKVTGTSWSKYAEPELLTPLGLNKTLFAHQTRIVEERAKGYIHQKDTLVNVPYRNIETFSAGGGLSSTIHEIVQWTHLLHNGKVVSAESLKKMTSPTVLTNGKNAGYGYGLYVNELRGHKKIYHGGTFGFGTYVSHYPEDGITIAILSNSTKGRERAEQLEALIAHIALDIIIKDLPISAADLDRYSGVYTYQSTPTIVRDVKVFGHEGKLMGQIGSNRPFLLRSQGNHKFIPVTEGITDINFEVKKGKTVGLHIYEGAWEVTPAVRKN